MKVNEIVKTIGYTRNRLEHFEFGLYDPLEEKWISISNATADDYIFLCDREVVEWMIDDDDIMSIIIYMVPKDVETFAEYLKY